VLTWRLGWVRPSPSHARGKLLKRCVKLHEYLFVPYYLYASVATRLESTY